eukprot:scaffold101141_cov21-Tisochrysis_lutea.AAC.1
MLATPLPNKSVFPFESTGSTENLSMVSNCIACSRHGDHQKLSNLLRLGLQDVMIHDQILQGPSV